MVIRTLWFCSILVTAVAGPFWLAVFLGVGYALCYQGLELIMVALIVDGYFGYGSAPWPYVTAATTVVLASVLLLRPHLTLYTE